VLGTQPDDANQEEKIMANDELSDEEILALFPPRTPPDGPLAFARKLLDNQQLAKNIHGHLKKIADETVDSVSSDNADYSKQWIKKYYTTQDHDEDFTNLGLSPDDHSALLRCTDRNYLIAAAATIGAEL
jgi:hypothetical protein